MKTLIVLFSIVAAFSTPAFAAKTAKDVVILDVRTDEEFAETHVKGAQQIDFRSADFKEKIAKLDKTKTYKVYCRSGNRSGKAIDMMKDMGFKDLENLGSVQDASKKLGVACEGKTTCE